MHEQAVLDALATALFPRTCDRIVRDLVKTRYGKDHGVHDVDSFHARLPIADYEAHRLYIEVQRASGEAALTTSSVIGYEATSGSASTPKWIPYTAGLRHSFSRMFAAWAYDVLTHGLRLDRGKLYMSVSPRFARGASEGFEDDRDYLATWLRPLVNRFLVDTATAQQVSSADAFRIATSAALLASPEMEIISIWNPSFLLSMLETIEAERERFIRSLILPLESRDALRSESIDWHRVFPNLKMISCWTSAAAAPLADRLQKCFPHVWIQGKGLLATEAPITLPWIRAGGYVPMLNEVYFEFEGEEGELHQLTDLDRGGTYQVIITQRGGLYRYRMNDAVMVTGRYRQTPCLAFVGRMAGVSDLVGEKLHPAAIAQALTAFTLGATATLVPLRNPDRYILLTDRCVDSPASVAARLEGALRANPHYALARSLGQLRPVAVAVSPNAHRLLIERSLRRGLKWGDIKPRVLETLPADAELSRQLLNLALSDPASAAAG